MHAQVALHIAMRRQTQLIDAIAKAQLEAPEGVVSRAKRLMQG
jgi:hypothetical protein